MEVNTASGPGRFTPEERTPRYPLNRKLDEGGEHQNLYERRENLLSEEPKLTGFGSQYDPAEFTSVKSTH
jgi:hypothetical protein